MKNPLPKNETHDGFKLGLPTRVGGFPIREGGFPLREGRRGFSFVELLVAIAIAAVVMTVTVVAFATINGATKRQGGAVDIQLPNGVRETYLDGTTGRLLTDAAPSYFQAAKAGTLRQEFYDDVDQSVAVFCLPRSGRSTIRPLSIPIPETWDGRDLRELDTPAAFRDFLVEAIPAAAGVFGAYENGISADTNLSIFILESASDTTLSVRAVYEVDFIAATDPVGVYTSVRRYSPTGTEFYDVFYPDLTLPCDFSPLVVAFERDIRGESRHQIAAERPFYFIWWPDPLGPAPIAGAAGYNSSTPLPEAYANMADRTSFFFIIPMFPAL